jgi:protein-tyrosine phosphatase
MIVALAYLAGPRLMGKRSDGRFAWWSTVLLLPFRLITHGTWLLGKAIAAEPVHAEIVPGVWMGRRARANELPPDIATIIDMTSELPDPRAVREREGYLCVPTLDASAPDEVAFKAALERIATSPGNVYIHCAQGHGRAGTLAAAVLIQRGLARDVDDAARQLARRRPRTRLNRRQRNFVAKMTQPTS